MAKKPPADKKIVASNRKARHQFEILQVFEAGLSLKGPEVKSLRAGKARLQGTFARVEGDDGRVWLGGAGSNVVAVVGDDVSSLPEPPGDFLGSAEYRAEMAAVLARRTLAEARARVAG